MWVFTNGNYWVYEVRVYVDSDFIRLWFRDRRNGNRMRFVPHGDDPSSVTDGYSTVADWLQNHAHCVIGRRPVSEETWTLQKTKLLEFKLRFNNWIVV